MPSLSLGPRFFDLSLGFFDLSSRFFKLSCSLTQLDLIGRGINLEQKVALVDDVSVLETDMCEGAAHLGTELDAFHGRVLPQELEPRRQILFQRHTNGNDSCRWTSGLNG